MGGEMGTDDKTGTATEAGTTTEAGTERQAETVDVAIIGGAAMGSALAFFLADDPAFRGRAGRVLVIEADPSLALAATSRSHESIRGQFTTEINIRLSRFSLEFLRDFRARLGGDEDIADINIRAHGYLTLATTAEGEARLKRSAALQRRLGVPTELLEADEIAARFPFLTSADVRLAGINTDGEGRFDGAAMVDGFRRAARRRGAVFVHDEVVGMRVEGGRVVELALASGRRIAPGVVVNAAGTRAAEIASMAGITLPIEPRKRYSWTFSTERPIEGHFPLVIDPAGVHVLPEGRGGRHFLCGLTPTPDRAVPWDDFEAYDEEERWLGTAWPTLARRIPAFERIKAQRFWVGHYDYNTFDANALLGFHPALENFVCMNGFSGHGLQQAPAVGLGVAEAIVHGRWQTLDLDPLHVGRLAEGRRVLEEAII